MVDEILNVYPIGNMAFNVPESVGIDETFTVRLILSPKKSVADIQNELDRSFNSVIQTGQVRLTPQMETRMTGQNFEISAVTPEILAVSSVEDTQWTWDIRAKQGGVQQLHLTVSAIIRVNDKSTPRVVRQFDRQINVRVQLGHQIAGFVKDNWQWLWTALLVPAVGWLWSKYHKKGARL